MKPKEKLFEYWFDNAFVCTRNPYSPILAFGDKRQLLKQEIIKQVCLVLISQKRNTEELRKDIALSFFISMRTALDYINYAKLILEFYNKQNAQT